MKSLLLLTLCLALPAQALARDLPLWKDVLANDKKYVKSPTLSEVQAFSSHAVKASTGPQIFTVGDRFVFLFDENGNAVVTFDLTQDHIGYGDMAMGAIGIGHWSIEGLFKLFRDIKDRPKDLIDGKVQGAYTRDLHTDFEDAGTWADINPNDLMPMSDKSVKKGYEQFSKLEFNDAFLSRHGITSGSRAGFAPTSFTLGDLFVKPDKREKAEKIFNRLALVLFKQDLASLGGLEKFTSMFQMNWDQKTEQFKMVWSPEKTLGKNPEIPGWVINYVNPTDTLAYKLELQQIAEYLGSADMIFGTYGAIAAMLVTRVTNSIQSQLDSHENQMLTFLEGAAAGIYDLGMPLQDANQFIDGSSLLLYLSKLEGSDDITNAQAKRKGILQMEAQNRGANVTWLQNHGFETKIWADQRSATVFKNGKRLGVASLVIDPMWLTHWQAWHFYDAVPFAKTTGRLGLELLVDAIRYVLPSYINLSALIPNVAIDIYIPGTVWDALIRGRAFTEIGYEGFVLSQVNAAIATKWTVPGYSKEELAKLKFWMHAQRCNPFETGYGHEATTMARNTRLINEFLNGGTKGDFQLRDDRLNDVPRLQ
jgi:hypothetical protein